MNSIASLRRRFEFVQKLQNLRLNSYVERRDWLVSDQQIRFQR